jgi:ATP-binding cassette subfamily B protein
MKSLRSRRRFLVPEVVQTSGMDCGPATLKCLFEGHRIPIHYGRLREACQTDVDGTSIDVMEEIANRLGLNAEQVMMPVDHLLLGNGQAFPAILVVRLPSGFTHFVLAWRRHGPLVQVMDPALGRRWLSCRQLLEDVYVHRQCVPAAAWHAWALSDDFRANLAERLGAIGCEHSSTPLFEEAAAASNWHALAELDAAVRLVTALVRGGGLRRGREAERVLRAFLTRDRDKASGSSAIPESYWSARPAPLGENGEEQVEIHGAVLVRVSGAPATPEAVQAADLSPELRAALEAPRRQPLRTLSRIGRALGVFSCLALIVGLALIAAGSVVEAVLLRSAIDINRNLGLTEQRLAAVGLFLAFAAGLLLLEAGTLRGLLRLGRILEARLRIAICEKIPRLHDRYFQSRPTSDMSERSHALHHVRNLPRQSGQFVRTALALGLTAGAIAWIDPASGWLALAAAAVAVLLPLLFGPLLSEMDLRVRTHSGALSRFYLDALLGLAAVRAHGAERAIRREHEERLVEWVRASRRLLRAVVVIEGLQISAGFGLAGWLLLLHVNRLSDTGGALLLAYWTLSLPVLGEEIASLVRQFPMQRSIILRLLEPLGALEEYGQGTNSPALTSDAPSAPVTKPGAAISLEGLSVLAGGQTILRDINVQISAGSHVAIVGVSGAGKSSLVGVLLGWHRPATGQVLVDGRPLSAEALDRLRGETAWIDPAVQIWNRSLMDNLLYGPRALDPSEIGRAIQDAGLYEVLQRLPEGMQTVLGEGGGLLSGGEGQRVRLGRALARPAVRLVILDEPYRGLDRDKRRQLLQKARHFWQEATLLCITHDVGETREFERVLVVEAGQVVEDGRPSDLAAEPHSRYRALLDAETAVRTGLWSSAIWRRLWLEKGKLRPARTPGEAAGAEKPG